MQKPSMSLQSKGHLSTKLHDVRSKLRGKSAKASAGIDQLVSPPMKLGTSSASQMSLTIAAKDVPAAHISSEIFSKYTKFAKEHSSALHHQLYQIVDREAGQTIKHAVKDIKHAIVDHRLPDRRGEIISGMLDWDDPDSAISRMMKDDALRVAQHLSAAAANGEPVNSAAVDKAIEKIGLSLPEVKPAQQGAALANQSAENDFATRLMDNFMRPHEETVDVHSHIVEAHVNDLRKRMNDLSAEFSKAGSTMTEKEFGKQMKEILGNSGKELRKKLGKNNFGLNDDQQRLLDHMHGAFSHHIFKYTGDLAIAVTLTSLLALLVPGQLTPIALMTLSRNMTVLLGGAVAQIETGKVVSNAAGERKYNPKGAQAAENAVLARHSAKLFGDSLEQVIGSFDSDFIDSIASDSATQAKKLQSFTTQIMQLTTPEACHQFSGYAAVAHDLLLDQQAEIGKKVAALKSVPQHERSAEQETQLRECEQLSKRIEPIRTHAGPAELTATEKTTAVLSFLERSADCNSFDFTKGPENVLIDVLADVYTTMDRLAIPTSDLKQAEQRWNTLTEQPPSYGQLELKLEDFALQAVRDSSGLTSFLAATTSKMYDGVAKDAAYKAVANTVYAITGLYLAGTVAGVGATIGGTALGGPLGGALAAAATGVASNKLARVETHDIFKKNIEKGIASGISMQGANVSRPAPKAADYASAYPAMFPKYEDARDAARMAVVLNAYQNECSVGLKQRQETGRTIATAMTANDSSGVMNLVTVTESFAAHYADAQQRLIDVAPDIATINAHELQLRQLHALKGDVDGTSAAFKADLYKYRNDTVVAKALAAHEKALQDLEHGRVGLQQQGTALVGQLHTRLLDMAGKSRDGAPVITWEELRSLKAFLLTPLSEPSVAAMVQKMELDLRDRNAIGNGPSRLAASISGLTVGQMAELNKSLGKCQQVTREVDASIHALIEDQRRFTNGDFSSDRHGIHDKLTQPATALLESRKLASPEYLTTRVAGQAVGRGMLQLPVYALVAGLSTDPTIAAALTTPLLNAEVPKSKVGMAGQVGGLITAFPAHPMTPFAAGNDHNTHYKTASAQFVSNLREYGGPLDLTSADIASAFKVAPNLDATHKTKLAHRGPFTSKHHATQFMTSAEYKDAKKSEKSMKDSLKDALDIVSPAKQMRIMRSTFEHGGDAAMKAVTKVAGLQNKVVAQTVEKLAERAR